MSARVRDLLRMDPFNYLRSQVGQDPHNFIDKINKKISSVMKLLVIEGSVGILLA